ncbi:MAG: hypothetical protein ACYCSS_08405 [Sulfuriferula sp.]
MKNYSFSLVHMFFIAAVFTTSFDIFLVLNFGFNFRATQILMIIPMAVAIVNAVKVGMIFPLGFGWLILWSMFILAFVPNTDFIVGSLGYAVWLFFDVLLIFTCVQLFSSTYKIFSLIRWYVYSFVFVAAFGLVQFVLPVLGLHNSLLVTQWWLPGILPRINGFSYEPSYFATYLLMGWVMCAYLLNSKSTLFARIHLQIYLLIISGSLILSSSRMGIFMLISWYMQYPLRFISRLAHGYVNKRFARISLILLGMAVLFFGFVIYVVGFDTVSFLFQGLGINEGASYSVDDRESGFNDVIAIFMNSPIVGYSLGGIPSAIAKLHGVAIRDIEDFKKITGFSVFAEVLAASGIFGIVPFAVYIWTIVSKPLRLARQVSVEQSVILIALTLALIFELAILQFNQNILRPYLWMHIAVMSASYAVFVKRRYGGDTAAKNDTLMV